MSRYRRILAATALSVASSATLLAAATPSLAQTAPRAGAVALRENAGPVDVLDPNDTVLLLIDHQVGLFNIVRDQSPEEYKDAVLGLAKTAKLMNIPVILSTSRDWGPNGPILPELRALFPNAPVIRRPGVINAYRWPEFRRAVEATGRKKVVIAAISASTCLQFPALDMVRDGYEVHGVLDASGSASEIEREATTATLAQAGVKVRNWWSVTAELQADWRRDEAKGWPLATQVFYEHLPSYGALMATSQAYAEGRMTPPK